MAKRSIKATAQPGTEERAWYTVRWEYDEPLQGGATGGIVEIHTKDKTEAQEAVESKLKAKGRTWKNVTVVKGRNTELVLKGDVGPYYMKLHWMLGSGPRSPYAWGYVEPTPLWASPSIMPDPDASARSGWDKFMDESSYGLSVSAYPRFILCDVDDYPILLLPPETVQNPKQWERITAVVREQLNYWKAILQERIERIGKIKRRSTEDADQLKQDMTTLKELEAFDGWSYKSYVEAMLPGHEPHSMDLDNIRLYRLSNGHLIPITNLGQDQLRLDFWRRLFSLWDGPVDKRADAVRAFLGHHYRKGAKHEQFLDLVKDTIPRLRKLSGYELLVDKVEEWIQLAVQYPAELMPTDSELSILEGMRWVLVKCVSKLPPPTPKPGTFGTDTARQRVRPGEVYMEEVRLVIEAPQCYQFVPATSEIATEMVERMLSKNPGLQLSRLDGSEPNALDTMNPYRTFNNGRIFAEVNGSSGAWQFLDRLRFEAAKLSTRATVVDAYLNHHYLGPNPSAFVEFIRGEVLKWKDRRSKAPQLDPLAAWAVDHGHATSHLPDPWLIDRCERWIENILKDQVELFTFDKLQGTEANAKVKEWSTLKACALFHALLFASTKTEIADLSTDKVAIQAGHPGKGCGKRLRTYFNDYRNAKGRMAKSTRNSAVLSRYDEVICKMGNYPEALALAKQERKEVYAREE